VTDRRIEQLESRLAANQGKAEARLVSSATTGIYLALGAAGITGQPVGIPNGVCVNVALAVLFSGNTPVYLDIDRSHLGIAMSAVREERRSLAAIIAVHAYGCICQIEELAQWCRASGTFLIEDLAVAQGAQFAGRPAGAWGDVSVMSFGAGKIIDVGGGGAVLADDRALVAEMVNLEAHLPVASVDDVAAVDEVSAFHTALYNASYGTDLNRHAAAFRQKALEAKRGFICGSQGEHAEAVLLELDRLADNLAQRERRARYLCDRFSNQGGGALSVWQPREGSVYWRLNLFASSGRDLALRTLLAQHYRISSWYPSVDLFLDDRETSGVCTPVSDEVGDTILNLWVNDEVDADYLAQASDAVLALSQAQR
jgi:dTDP-4-amino-4,6-dideoxygalactose transaminase